MRKYGSFCVAAFVGALLAVVISGQLRTDIGQNHSAPNTISKNMYWQQVSMTDANTNQEIAPNMIEAARMGRESVVHIRSIKRISAGMPPGEEMGSGVIISDDGLILTNSHVVNGADRIVVTLPSLYEKEVELVAADALTDLALLRIPNANTTSVEFGNSDELEVGEWILAVGNPLNLSSSVTAGIVSGMGRSVKRANDAPGFECFIQTDAVLNKGSSGGALLNSRGQLVGINTAIASESGKFEGYSFSIPANVALKVAEDLENTGVIQKAFLGAEIRDLESSKDAELKLEELRGCLVEKVISKSAKGKGLYEEDIIRQINGVNVNSVKEVEGKLAQFRPGQVIEITVLRDLEIRRIEAELVNAYNETGPIKVAIDPMENHLGAELRNMTPKELAKNYLQNGIQVTKLLQGLLRHQTSIQEGFIITKINNREVRSVNSFYARVKRFKSGDHVTISGFYPKNPEVKYYHFVKP